MVSGPWCVGVPGLGNEDGISYEDLRVDTVGDEGYIELLMTRGGAVR